MELYVCRSLLGGLTLAGYKQLDGSVVSTSGVIFDNGFPEEIIFAYKTFTLEEEIFVGKGGDPKGRFYNAEYI